MSITGLSTNDRTFTRLESTPVLPCEDAARAIFDGLQAAVKPPPAIPFVQEVPFQTDLGPIQIRPYGAGYWVPIGELTRDVRAQAITRLLDDAAHIDEFAINEAFRRHCPEPLRCVDVRDAVNQLRNKGQTITHVIIRDGVEVPDDLNLIVHRFPVADGFVLTGASEAPILLTRETGFEFLTNVVGGNTGDRASFAIERKVGVSVIGPLELCRVVSAA